MSAYRANGKLLLTGEYVVLDGVPALALPTKPGQTLEVNINIGESTLRWSSWDADGSLWLELELNPDTWEVLQSTDEAAAATTRRTLLTVLEALLRALHPIMPFITEEIWQRVAPVAGVAGETIMRAAWPRAADYPADAAATADVDWMKGVILGLRQIRGEMDISPARRLAPLVQGATVRDAAHFERHAALLGRLAGIDPVRVLTAGENAPPSAAAVVGHLTLLVPMQGLIDPAEELARLRRKQEKNQQEITRALAKLENPNFVNHAPPEVVATERERIAQFEKVNESLARQIAIVEGLVQT